MIKGLKKTAPLAKQKGRHSFEQRPFPLYVDFDLNLNHDSICKEISP